MEDLIYKFLSLERLTYLSDEYLRITQPGDLNDPFECLPAIPSSEDTIHILEKIETFHLANIEKQTMSRTDKRTAKNNIIKKYKSEIAKVKKDTPNNLRRWFFTNAINTINTTIGILSLSKRWDSSLMWAHYTTSHKGFCIGFDSSDPFFNSHTSFQKDSQIIYQAVNYGDSRIKVPVEKGEKIDPIVLFTKSIDWQYEHEFRLLVMLSLADKKIESKPFDIYLYKIPHALIREIIVGVNTPQQEIKMIQSFCRGRNIQLFQAKISEEKFEMERSAMA